MAGKPSGRVTTYSKQSPEKKRKHDLATLKWRHDNPEATLLKRARQRARLHNIPFDIEVSDIVIPEICPVYNMPLEVHVGCRGGKPNSPSLDRIDPSKGYVKDNIIVVSNKANNIKSNATPEEIIQVGKFYRRLAKEKLMQYQTFQYNLPKVTYNVTFSN